MNLAALRTRVRAPKSIEVALLGSCQLACDWCWGPMHNQKEGASLEQWKEIISKMGALGTELAVFTGGEPLISQFLLPLLRHTKDSGMQTMVSTNAILLPQRMNILPYTDQIGIPIDGSNPLKNDEVRRLSKRFGAWEKSVDGMRRVQSVGGFVIARTVLCRANLDDVRRIPEVLVGQGVDTSPAHFRQKLYQVEPIGYGSTIPFDEWQSKWAITDDEARAAHADIRAAHPNLTLGLQLYKETAGRYFVADPACNAYGTDIDSNGRPVTVPYGNLITDLEGSVQNHADHRLRIAQAAAS